MIDVTVYYDGECPLCRREIGIYKRLKSSGNIDYVNIETTNFICNDLNLKKSQLKARFHIKKNGRFLSGGYAFVELWKHYPRLKVLYYIFNSRLMGYVLDMIYNGFLMLRPVLQSLFMKFEDNNRYRK